MDKRLVTILLTIVVLVLIALNIMIYINNHKEVSQAEANYNELISNSGNENNKQFTESEIENTVTNKVMTLPEKNRMQIFWKIYILY